MHHDYPKQEFHHAHTSMGAFGHVMRTAGLLTPLIIGEFVKDADKRWRDTRIASVGTALLSEAIYAIHQEHEKKEREAEREQCWQERIGREREGRQYEAKPREYERG